MQTLGALLAVTALAASYAIQTAKYSVYHDELWNHPQAVALLNGRSWVAAYEVRLFGQSFPLVSGPYQGAIKSYLLVPWIGVFGTNPWSLRLFNVLLAVAVLVTLRWALQAVVGQRLIWLAFAAPWLFPALLTYAPTDQGPVLLTLAFSSLSLGAVARYLQEPDVRWVALALAGSSLVLSDKITAFPLAMAGYAATALAALRWGHLRHLVSPQALAGASIPLLPWALYFALHGFSETLGYVANSTSISTWQRLRHQWVWIVETLGGGHMVGLGHQAVPPMPLWLPWLALPCALFVAVLAAVGKAKSAQLLARINAVFFAAFAVAYVTSALIPGLYRPWHFVPFLPVVALLSSASLASLLRLTRGFLHKTLLWVLTGFAAHDATQAVQGLWFLRQGEGANLTSPALYEVAAHLQRERIATIVCLNYSLCNPLFVLSGGQLSFVETTWWPANPTSWQQIVERLQTPRTALVWRVPSPHVGQPAEAQGLLEKVLWAEKMQETLGPRLSCVRFPDAAGTQFVVGQLATSGRTERGPDSPASQGPCPGR
ncbi:MAG: hypothetical protein N2447_08005 [Thermoanaerobaculum sp.]|nr:hypothetical protein [Thermoanaerobaculum sp.]